MKCMLVPAKVAMAGKKAKLMMMLFVAMSVTACAAGPNPKDFDVVVREGESIQAAIEQAPEMPEKPFTIFIEKGLYEQKVIATAPKNAR